MDEKAAKHDVRGGITVTLLAVLVLLPILYLLSIGPAYKMSGGTSVPFTRTFYKPVDWAAGACPPFRRAIVTYLNRWDPPPEV